METYVISLLVFGLAFAGMALGPSLGRPLASRSCGECPRRERPTGESGGDGCRP